MICSLVKESAKSFTSKSGRDSAISVLKLNLGNSLHQLMTGCQYYCSAFDGFNWQQLFNVQICVWDNSINASRLDLTSLWRSYFSMDNIMTASPFFIANKASVSNKSKVKSWPFRFKLKHHNFNNRRNKCCFTHFLVLSSCTGSQEPLQRTKRNTTANQWLLNKERTMVIPLWTRTPGQNPLFVLRDQCYHN